MNKNNIKKIVYFDTNGNLIGVKANLEKKNIDLFVSMLSRVEMQSSYSTSTAAFQNSAIPNLRNYLYDVTDKNEYIELMSIPNFYGKDINYIISIINDIDKSKDQNVSRKQLDKIHLEIRKFKIIASSIKEFMTQAFNLQSPEIIASSDALNTLAPIMENGELKIFEKSLKKVEKYSIINSLVLEAMRKVGVSLFEDTLTKNTEKSYIKK